MAWRIMRISSFYLFSIFNECMANMRMQTVRLGWGGKESYYHDPHN